MLVITYSSHLKHSCIFGFVLSVSWPGAVRHISFLQFAEAVSFFVEARNLENAG